MGVDNDTRVVLMERRRMDNISLKDDLWYRVVVHLGCAQKYFEINSDIF